MSSLVPGAIFMSPGFNRKSTPTPPDITPDQLDKKYKWEGYNGHDWPADSPVSRSYDVANTSTKLIILNNKYGQKSTRLRGYYTGPKKPDRSVNPERHRAKSPRDPRYHDRCLDSSSPKFEPAIKTDLEWINASHRPPNALIVRSSVNPARHASCRISPEMQVENSRPHSRLSLPAKYLNNSEYADMSIGERIYMWSIEKIYNMEKMKKLKQEQYQKLLDSEAKKGTHNYGEYLRYRRYISSASDRNYGTRSPSATSKRSRSAYSQRSRSGKRKSSPAKSDTKSEEKDKDETERPKTSLGQTRTEPREASKSPSRDESPRSASVGSVERKRIGSQSSIRKSPASSRKSSARSQMSIKSSPRSKSSGRVPSRTSLQSGEQTKGDNFDTIENSERFLHKEGKDRPKSRLGHPGGTDDRDKESLTSSSLSIRSDHLGSSSDSGLTKSENVTKQKKFKDSKSKLDSRSDRRNSKGNAKPNKSMGSCVSIGSKSSKTSDNKKFQTDNNVNGKDTEKVHRIPSATYVKNETSDEYATDEKTDGDKEVAKEKTVIDEPKTESKDVVKQEYGDNELKSESTDNQTKLKEINNENNEKKKILNEFDSNEGSKESEQNLQSSKPLDNDTEKKADVDDSREDKEKNKDGIAESEIERSLTINSNSENNNAAVDNGSKIESDKPRKNSDGSTGSDFWNTELREVKPMVSDTEMQEKDGMKQKINEKTKEESDKDIKEEIDDEIKEKTNAEIKENTNEEVNDDEIKVNGSNHRNKLSRQESFDDEDDDNDDDRKVNKDIDKIEY